MNIVLITIEQAIILMVLILIGVICTKAKMIDSHINKGMSALLVHIVTPCLIISNLQVDATSENIKGILTTFLIAFIIYLVNAFLVIPLFRKNATYDYKVARFMCMYANCGYMGVPLVKGILGNKGVFYIVAFIAVFNLFAFTHGIILMRNENDKVSLKSLISPALIAVFLGMLFLVTGFKLPIIISAPLKMMSELNTPLAMIVAGFSIANTNFKDIRHIGRIIEILGIKLLVIPIIVIFAIAPLPLKPMIKLVSIITSACSCATVGVIFSVKYERDTSFAAILFAASTLLITISLPLIMYITSCVGIKL